MLLPLRSLQAQGSSNLGQADVLAKRISLGMGGRFRGLRQREAGKQGNACDCGVFSLLFAEALARGQDPADVSQGQATAMRSRMRDTILKLAQRK
eukprot:s1585_g8.t1